MPSSPLLGVALYALSFAVGSNTPPPHAIGDDEHLAAFFGMLTTASPGSRFVLKATVTREARARDSDDTYRVVYSWTEYAESEMRPDSYTLKVWVQDDQGRIDKASPPRFEQSFGNGKVTETLRTAPPTVQSYDCAMPFGPRNYSLRYSTHGDCLTGTLMETWLSPNNPDVAYFLEHFSYAGDKERDGHVYNTYEYQWRQGTDLLWLKDGMLAIWETIEERSPAHADWPYPGVDQMYRIRQYEATFVSPKPSTHSSPATKGDAP